MNICYKKTIHIIIIVSCLQKYPYGVPPPLAGYPGNAGEGGSSNKNNKSQQTNK